MWTHGYEGVLTEGKGLKLIGCSREPIRLKARKSASQCALVSVTNVAQFLVYRYSVRCKILYHPGVSCLVRCKLLYHPCVSYLISCRLLYHPGVSYLVSCKLLYHPGVSYLVTCKLLYHPGVDSISLSIFMNL